MLVSVSLLGQLDAKHEVWVLHARVDHALKQDRQTVVMHMYLLTVTAPHAQIHLL